MYLAASFNFRKIKMTMNQEQFDNLYRKIGTVVAVLIVLGILIAVGYFIYEAFNSLKSKK